MLLTVVLFFSFNILSYCQECKTRVTENGFVCVCNSSYCDSLTNIHSPGANTFQMYSTSKTKPGFTARAGQMSGQEATARILEVTGEKFQRIIGFGGAFTDASGINIKKLPADAQNKLLESYFGDNGIGYSLGRVPIGGCDFSTRPYSYDDVDGDVYLEHFKLQEEDMQYKIPIIRQAKALRKEKPLELLASAWTAPPWMKTNKTWTGYSTLKKENHGLFARYLTRFFNEYRANKVDFWGMTTGNEPLGGFLLPSKSLINSMGWIPHIQSKWIRNCLVPSLQNSSHNLKIIIHDDNRNTLPYVVPFMLNDKATARYIDGVGVHWYEDNAVSPDVLYMVKSPQRDIFHIVSEACIFREGLSLGSWERGTRYISSILEYMNYGSAGWIDWNIALDLEGGPNYIRYFADSPIIVNASSGEFYKQPLFYAIGHFSKFVVPDSVRLGIKKNNLNDDKLRAVAFTRPDSLKVVVIFNNGTENVDMQIRDNSMYTDVFTVDANSINTILYNSNDQNVIKKEY